MRKRAQNDLLHFLPFLFYHLDFGGGWVHVNMFVHTSKREGHSRGIYCFDLVNKDRKYQQGILAKPE